MVFNDSHKVQSYFSGLPEKFLVKAASFLKASERCSCFAKQCVKLKKLKIDDKRPLQFEDFRLLALTARVREFN